MFKQFLKYTVPSVCAMILFSLYTMVDGIFVAQGVGEVALAAVNLSMPFINAIFALSLLFATGTSTIAAICLGQGDAKEAGKTFTMSLCLLACLSVVLACLGLFFLEPIALFLGADSSTLVYVMDYLRIILLFNGCFMVSYCLEVLVKTDGVPQLAIVGILVGAVTNIVLDYLFVIVWGYGIKGAAIATGISQFLTAILFLLHFFSKKAKIHLLPFRFSLCTVWRIAKIGFPDSITELSTGLIIFLFNQRILQIIGVDGLVSYTVISYLNTLAVMIVVGISQGMQPLVSFHYGKGEPKVYQGFLRLGIKAAAFCGTAFFVTLVLLDRFIIALFIPPQSVELFEYTCFALRLFSLSFLVVGFNVIISGFFAAVERASYALTISLCRGVFVIALSLYVVSALFGHVGIWLAPLVSELICLVVTLSLFLPFYKTLKNKNLPKNV